MLSSVNAVLFAINKNRPAIINRFQFICLISFPCWPTCISQDLQQKWTYCRTAVLAVVGTPAFEWFVLVLIFASSITLCFEDIHLDSNLTLKRVLYWTNFVFSLVFVIEMVLKWMALGFTKYFTSFWTILDFIIVFVSIFLLSSLRTCHIQQSNKYTNYRSPYFPC